MNTSESEKKIPLAEKDLLLDLITTLKEKESLEQVKKLISDGYSSAELFSCCMEGVRRVGVSFEKGEFYISALIMAGEIMRQLAEYLHSSVRQAGNQDVIGHVLLGTIKGDIHDLGKNILKDMFVCNGFKVTDLGVDVPIQSFVDNAVELDPDFVAISCLLTNCLDNLEAAVKATRQAKPGVKDLIIVGGYCLDELVNDFVRADMWFTDAALAIEFCKETMQRRRRQAETGELV